MASTWLGGSDWLARVRNSTDALGFSRSRLNISRLGKTRWTRTAWTASIERMLRTSSPSSARTRFTSCMKLVVPSVGAVSNSS